MRASTWLTAWGVSLIIAVGVYFLIRRTGLRRSYCVMLAALCFPSPLFYVMKGRASYVYTLDLVTPFLIYTLLRKGNPLRHRLSTPATALFLSVGLLPALSAFLTLNLSHETLVATTNMYRVAGVLSALMILATAQPGHRVDAEGILSIFSFISLAICVAMLLQLSGVIYCNTMDELGGYVPSDGLSERDSLVNVLGLFRGSMGWLAYLGIGAYLASPGSSRWMAHLLLSGAIAGAVMILVSGSKTTLVAVTFAVAGGLLLSRAMRRRALGAAVVMTLAFPAIGEVTFLGGALRESADFGLAQFVATGGQRRGSLDARVDTWESAGELIRINPRLWPGLGGHEDLPLDIGYYHSEYVLVLAMGGVLGLVLYLFGLATLARRLLFETDVPAGIRRLGILVLVGGVVQGVSVCHIMPGIYFCVPSAAICIIYGLAGRANAWQRSRTFRELLGRGVDGSAGGPLGRKPAAAVPRRVRLAESSPLPLRAERFRKAGWEE